MRPSRGLVVLAARRLLSPAGACVLAGALLVAVLVPWSPAAAESTAEGAQFSAEVGAGLARQGTWLTALVAAFAWFASGAARAPVRWRAGEGAWLGAAVPSRAHVASAHALGVVLALALALAPFALAAEFAAGGAAPRLLWIADARVAPVVLLHDRAVGEVRSEPPPGASVAVARFVIAAPDDGPPLARVRCTTARAGAETVVREVLATGNTSVALDVPAGLGPVRFAFERVGPGAAAVLEGPRLAWLRPAGSRWAGELALCLHAWLALSAAALLAQGVAAWTGTATACLAAFSLLALAWLDEEASRAWPGVSLRQALEAAADGHAARLPDGRAWLGACAVSLAAPLLAALRRDLWRRAP